MFKNELIYNINLIHTTELGKQRIKNNIDLYDDNIIEWCKSIITNRKSIIKREGKNWYVINNDIIITINASSYTIITVHRQM